MIPPNLSPAPVTPSSVWEQLEAEAQQQVISLVAQLALKWLSWQADQTHQADPDDSIFQSKPDSGEPSRSAGADLYSPIEPDASPAAHCTARLVQHLN